MNAMLLNPRTAAAVAIARAQMPYDPQQPINPAAVRDLAHDRFGLDLTAGEIQSAIEAVSHR